MSAAARMPRGGPIRPRHPTFDLEEALAGDWHGGSPFRTAFFNAMSLSFPSGERFFIDAVRAHEEGIGDPALKEAVRGLHRAGGGAPPGARGLQRDVLPARGYDLAALEAPFLAGVEWSEANLSPLARLAATVALEHLTATLAAALLDSGAERAGGRTGRHDRPGLLADADPRVAELWRWHAVEEIEHKSVAFDVHAAAGGCPKKLRRTLKPVTLNSSATTSARSGPCCAMTATDGRSSRPACGGCSDGPASCGGSSRNGRRSFAPASTRRTRTTRPSSAGGAPTP